MQNKRRILLLTTAYLPFAGGAELAWQAIIQKNPQIYFDILTTKLDYRLPGLETGKNFTIYRLGLGLSFDKFALPVLAFIKAWFLYQRHHYSLIIGVMYSYASLSAAWLKMFYPETHYLLNLQDGDTEAVIKQKTQGLQFITKAIYKKADLITTISSYLTKRAKTEAPQIPTQQIPNGVDFKIFKNTQTNKTKKQITIVSTSRLNYKNGLETLIKSFSYLPVNFCLEIIGKGEEEKKLRALVLKLRLKQQVKFVGYLPQKKLVNYLKKADYFCRPSLQEGLGNSFLEAMAMRIPVIATRTGGITDFLTDRQTGLFCEKNNPQDLAEKILFLHHQPLLRQKIIANAYQLVRTKYNWISIGKSYKVIFQNFGV